MLSLFGRVVQFFKKDFEFLTKYERSHPHFFWYLGLDALVSVALIFGGYSVYSNMTTDRHELKHVGAEVMSSEEIIEHAHENNVLAYWLGSTQGYEYTMDHSKSGIADIFYWQKGSYHLGKTQFLYEIKTYKNQQTWNSRGHTLLASAGTETVTVNEDVTIRINPKSMRGVIVTFISKPEIVALAYPVPQNLQEMVKNVESLKLVE